MTEVSPGLDDFFFQKKMECNILCDIWGVCRVCFHKIFPFLLSFVFLLSIIYNIYFLAKSRHDFLLLSLTNLVF